tara:strand:+ start:1440 stop:1895 length:456 start_codon:yes stop_codon:yes gene_type:complete
MDRDIAYGFALKRLIEDVLGKNSWLDAKECTSLDVWKKLCTRLLKANEATILSSVEVCDDRFTLDIKKEVEHGLKMISSSKDFTTLFMALSSALSTISFLQCGGVPITSKRSVRVQEGMQWKMDSVRSVQYVQTKEQLKRVKHWYGNKCSE